MDTQPQDRETLIAFELYRVDGHDPTGEEVSQKHDKMCANPFRFLRGAAQLYYNDLSTGVLTLPAPFSETVKLTGVMGDCHMSNFGFVTEKGSGGGHIVFTPDDFDDACIGHAGWDLCRFIVSIFLAVEFSRGIVDGRYETEEVDDLGGLSAPDEKDAAKAANAFLKSYRKTCEKIIAHPQRRRIVLDSFPKKHVLGKPLKKAHKRAIGGKKFETKSKLGKAIVVENGEMRFKDKPGRLHRVDPELEQEIREVFRPYVDDEIVDLVERVGQGTGSVNVPRYYLLIGPPGVSTIAELPMCHLVEIKQQRLAAPLAFFKDLDPRNTLAPAHLTVDLQRQMQREPDILLDDVEWNGHQWMLRSRHHASVSLDPEEVCLRKKKPGKRLKQYVKACGAALAYAHSRMDHRSTRFETSIASAIEEAGAALVESSEAYARKTVDDWRILWSMTRAGDPISPETDRPAD